MSGWYHDKNIEEDTDMSKASDLIRNHNIGKVGHMGDIVVIPKNVECKKDLQYGPDKEWNLFDIYYETSNQMKHPTLISIHGGGWVSNTKESYEPYCLDLATRGFNVINFTLRLAPENVHPAMIEDINHMVTYLIKHQTEYGLDMENVFMIGDSAGAHMLSIYIGICTNKEYASEFPFQTPSGFLPKGIALNCGVYDILYEIEHDTSGLIKELIFDYIGFEDSKTKLMQVNSIDYVNASFPPVYLMCGNNDALLSQYTRMYQKLKDAGIVTVHKVYGDEKKPLGHVFHLDIYEEDAKKCNDDECSFFKNLIK